MKNSNFDNYLEEGFTREQLRAIGERKATPALPISATDINAAIPFAVSEQMRGQFAGQTPDELRAIGEGKMTGLPDIQPCFINGGGLSERDPLMEQGLDNLNKDLGIRLS